MAARRKRTAMDIKRQQERLKLRADILKQNENIQDQKTKLAQMRARLRTM